MEREEGREKERDKNINVWLPLTCPLPRTWPTTQACALIGNQTCDPLVLRLALHPLSPTSQDRSSSLRHLPSLVCISLLRGEVLGLLSFVCTSPCRAQPRATLVAAVLAGVRGGSSLLAFATVLVTREVDCSRRRKWKQWTFDCCMLFA